MEIGENQDWLLRGPSADQAGVELWTARRLPFATEQDASQKRMVRRVALRLAELRGCAGQRLAGLFASELVTGRQPDAENIVFYNFGLAAFRVASTSIAFERSYRRPPLPPVSLGQELAFYHCWTFNADDAPLQSWALAEAAPVASWSGVPLTPSGGDLGLAVWWALRQCHASVSVRRQLSASDTYLISVEWSVPALPAIKSVNVTKALIDGSLAALQRAEDLSPKVLEKLLRRSWPTALTGEELLDLVRAERSPVALPRCPFNGNGLDPCDENCVAGIVRIVPGTSSGSLAGQLWKVSPREA